MSLVAVGGHSINYTRYVMAMIFLVAVFNTCDRTIISVIADDIKSDLVLSDRQMGLLLGLAFSVTYFIAGIPLARLADRWSRPKVISLALFIWSGMTIASGMATNFVSMAFSRMGVGIGEAGGSPPSNALIAEYIAPERRARAMAILSIGALFGLGLGVVYGGWASEAIGWRFALISVGVPGLLLGFLFYPTIKDYRRVNDSFSQDNTLLGDFLGLFRIKSFTILVLAACAANTMVMAVAMWTPTLLRRVYHMDATNAGLWHFVIAIVPSAIGMLFGASMADRLAARDKRWLCWIPALGCLLSFPFGIAFALYEPGSKLFGSIPSGFLFGIGMSLMLGAWSPITMSMAQQFVNAKQRSLAAATWSMLAALVGGGAGPYLVGDIATRLESSYGELSIQYALAASCLFSLVASGFYYLLSRSIVIDTNPND